MECLPPLLQSLRLDHIFIVGLDMADRVNKFADKEANMASRRKQFLKDNQEKHEANNYEFKRSDKDDKVPTTNGTYKQPKEKRLKKKWFSYFLFFLALNVFILKVDVKPLNLGII